MIKIKGSDPTVIANELFIKYSVNSGLYLAETFTPTHNFNCYLKNMIDSQLRFTLVDEEHIVGMFNRLKNKSSYDCDNTTELASIQLPDYLIKLMDQGGTPLNIYILIFQMPLTLLIILYYCPNKVIMETPTMRINFLSAICPTDINMLNTIMHNL